MTRADLISRLVSRRLILVLGKGGVGKSTVSAGIGLMLRRAGKRVLVAELNAKEAVTGLLGRGPVGPELAEVEPGLWCVDISPAEAMREFALLLLRYRFIYNAVFENRMVKFGLKAIPALPELLMLGKIWHHEGECGDLANPAFDDLFNRRQDRSAAPAAPRFDAIVVDCPAMGHGVALLRAPFTVEKAAPSGQLRTIASRITALIADRTRTAICVVATPEELPVKEAAEIVRIASGELGLAVEALVLNGMFPPPFEQDEEGAFEAVKEALGRARNPVAGLMAGCAGEYLAIFERQQFYRRKAAETAGVPMVELPYVFAGSFGRPEVEGLAAVMEGKHGGGAAGGGGA